MVELRFSKPPATNANLLFAGEPLNPTDLRFSLPAPATPNLLFGETGDDVIPPVSANLTAVLTKLTASIFVSPPIDASVGAVLPKPFAEIFVVPAVEANLATTLPPAQFNGLIEELVGAYWQTNLPNLISNSQAQYISNTQRPLVNRTKNWWQLGGFQDQLAATTFDGGQRFHNSRAIFWNLATQLETGLEHRILDQLKPDRTCLGIIFQDGHKLHYFTKTSYQDSLRIKISLGTSFQEASFLRSRFLSKYQDMDHSKRIQRTVFWQEAVFLRKSYHTSFQRAKAYDLCYLVLWQEAQVPPPGISLIPKKPPPPPKTCDEPVEEKLNLIFFYDPREYEIYLKFKCRPTQSRIIPVKKVYIMLNSLKLYRASDNVEIPTYNFTLSIDASSWAWGFSAVIPGRAESLISNNTGPVELIADVNSFQVKVLVESIKRERSFGDNRLRISGRGHHAYLSSPYSPVMTFSQPTMRTAQQLMNDALTVNGVPLGWTVDWRLTDWFVPANTFSFTGTYIDAVNSIASAAGGYIYPDPTAKTIYVLHRYPTPPWDWNSIVPDIALPVDAVSRESINVVNKPVYNRVFVAGTISGIIGQVTRQGTAGDVVAPMVTDQLITEEPAARQRGISILADTGKQLELELRLPVFSGIGVITPGKMVRYEDGPNFYIGIVRSVSIEASFPELWQTIGVEVHV